MILIEKKRLEMIEIQRLQPKNAVIAAWDKVEGFLMQWQAAVTASS